jgi:uncharacterized protein YabN with tetrapyrrole methylase and pyrophosphatase domain
MFNKDKVRNLQCFIKEQSVRKEAIGKAGYAERKLWEEMVELRDEIHKSISDRRMTENLINELGDFLFCVLGNKELADQLQQRLDYDVDRAGRYEQIDLVEIEKQRGA